MNRGHVLQVVVGRAQRGQAEGHGGIQAVVGEQLGVFALVQPAVDVFAADGRGLFAHTIVLVVCLGRGHTLGGKHQ